MLPVSPNGFATVTAGVLSVPSPLKCSTSTIALGTQAVPGALLGGRVNPLAVKTYCPFRMSFVHLFVASAAASPGRHRINGKMAAHLVVRCFMGFPSSFEFMK